MSRSGGIRHSPLKNGVSGRKDFSENVQMSHSHATIEANDIELGSLNQESVFSPQREDARAKTKLINSAKFRSRLEQKQFETQ